MSDIVTQLRKWADNAHEQGVSEVVDGLRSAAAEIERLRAQRDEARRGMCKLMAQLGANPDLKKLASVRGWDCFKEGKP